MVLEDDGLSWLGCLELLDLELELELEWTSMLGIGMHILCNNQYSKNGDTDTPIMNGSGKELNCCSRLCLCV